MKRQKIDLFLFVLVCALVLLGLFAFFSAAIGLISRADKSVHIIILKQLILGVGGGFLAFFIFSRIPYVFFKKYALLIFLFSIIITLLVFVPKIGVEHGGAKRWLKLGFLTIQPSEILKFGFIVYLSAWISSRGSNISSFQFGFLPFLVMIGILSAVLIMEPDIGTLGITIVAAAILFFTGGGKLYQICALILLIVVALTAIVSSMDKYGYAMSRISIFLNPALDSQNKGYQLNQSLIAIGSGEIFGKGFGRSTQKFGLLPEPMGDSIFAVIAEEFGFIGSILLLIILLAFLVRGLQISKSAPDIFGRLLGTGIVILIIGQSFVNIGAMMGIFPLTGIPLLFISHGGTSLAVSLAEVGILLNISKNHQRF